MKTIVESFTTNHSQLGGYPGVWVIRNLSVMRRNFWCKNDDSVDPKNYEYSEVWELGVS